MCVLLLFFTFFLTHKYKLYKFVTFIFLIILIRCGTLSSSQKFNKQNVVLTPPPPTTATFIVALISDNVGKKVPKHHKNVDIRYQEVIYFVSSNEKLAGK